MPQTQLEANRKYRLNNPWANCLFAARNRCNNPKNSHYKYYGARGIKCFLNLEEIKNLWIRDNAKNMVCPTIDRIDNDGDYILDNCRFIERSENSRRSNLSNPRWVTKKGCKHDNGLSGKFKLKEVQCRTCNKIFRPSNHKVIFCSGSCSTKNKWKIGCFNNRNKPDIIESPIKDRI